MSVLVIWDTSEPTYMCCILTNFHEWQNDRRLITCNKLKPHIQLSNLKTNISFTWVKWLRTFALWLRHHLNQKVEPTGLRSSRYLSKSRFSKTASADVLENKLWTTLFMTGGVYRPIAVKYMQRLLCVRDKGMILWVIWMSSLARTWKTMISCWVPAAATHPVTGQIFAPLQPSPLPSTSIKDEPRERAPHTLKVSQTRDKAGCCTVRHSG